MNDGLRLHKLGLQVSDVHLLLLQRSEVLLGVRGHDSMVVSAGMIATQSHPPGARTNTYQFCKMTMWN